MYLVGVVTCPNDIFRGGWSDAGGGGGRGRTVLDALDSPAGLDGAFWRAFWRYGKDLGLGRCAEDVLRDTVGRYGRGWDVRGGREEVGSYRAFEVEEER